MIDPKVCIVIPTYNEQETIADVINSVKLHSDNILVMDGNSGDKTCEIARKLGVKLVLQKSKGKGAALRQAIAECDSEIIVFIDADGSHDAGDIPKMTEPLLNGCADMVLASRFLGGSDELHGTWDNFVRMTGSCLVTLAINYRWQVHLTDVENGFRAVKTKAARELGLTSDDFTIEQEMIMKAAKKGLRILEIPSHEYKRKGGSSKLPTSQGWRFIFHFLKDIW